MFKFLFTEFFLQSFWWDISVLFEIIFYELADTQFFQLKIDCDERLVMLKFNKFKYFLLSFATI